MNKKIVQIGDPILTKKTTQVTDIDSEETKSIVKDLLDTCMSNKDGTAGLSAPQISYSKRICVCRRIDLEEKHGEGSVKDEHLWEVMINPIITNISDEKSTFWEACLSIGEGNNKLFGPVSRPLDVTIKYTSPSGEEKQLSGTEFFSHVIQHELDHLDGILFLTYVTNPENIWPEPEFESYINETGDYPPIV